MSGSAAPARPASGSLSKLQLTAIISVDAFSGRFSFNALILTNRFRDTIMESGALFFTAGNLAAAAQLLAAPISRRMGLGCTMFCGRVPANLLLFLAALILFALTFLVNTIAELVRQRLRRRYAQL